MENEQGELIRQDVLGMLLSHSCDFDEEAVVVFSPCYPFRWFRNAGNASSIRANHVFHNLYLPPSPRRDATVVDLSIVQTFRTSYIRAGLESGALVKIEGFTDIGWYFLISKLTLHFMRPQPAAETRGVSKPTLSERVRTLVRQGPAVFRYLLFGR